MKDRMKIHKEIATQASTKDFYKKAQDFGTRAVPIFKDNKSGRTQLNNLQNIVNSSLKVTNTIDYIKRQIGHGKSGFKDDNFGNDLITYLYDNLAKVRDFIKKELNDLELDDYQLQEIHLLLCRQFINSLVIHYNYERQQGGQDDSESES